MNTSRSIVLFGVSSRYLCHTCSATSCGDDLLDRGCADAVVFGSRTATAGVVVLTAGAGGLDAGDVAGFFGGILRR